MTNRSWFVRGPGFTHSRTVHERVAALVSLAASSADRHHPSPDRVLRARHPRSRRQRRAAAGRRRVQQRLDDPGRGRGRARLQLPDLPCLADVPGARDVRVLFRGDRAQHRRRRRIRSTVLDPADRGAGLHDQAPVGSDRRQRAAGDDLAARCTSPGRPRRSPSTSVSLFGARARTGPFHEVQPRPRPPRRELQLHERRVDDATSCTRSAPPSPPHRHTARSVRGRAGRRQHDRELADLDGRRARHVHRAASHRTRPGHVIYLQKLGKDGDWHTVEVGFVQPELDVRVRLDVRDRRAPSSSGPGSPAARSNVGGASPPVTIDVTAAAADLAARPASARRGTSDAGTGPRRLRAAGAGASGRVPQTALV